MSRRRDMRRFGRGPFVEGFRRDEEHWKTGFPFEVPAVAQVERMALDAPITLLAGDNGTGKSTLIEAIAEAIGFAAEGGELERAGALPAVPRSLLAERSSRSCRAQSHATATSCVPRASSTSRSSSTAAATSRPTSRSTATCRYTSSRFSR